MAKKSSDNLKTGHTANITEELQEQVPAQDPVKTRLKTYVSALYDAASMCSLPKKTHDGLLGAAVELTKFIENS